MGRKVSKISREVQEYIPKDWKDEKGNPEENPFTVSFKPLSKRQLAGFQDNSSRVSIGSNAILLGNATGNINVFKEAVVGWKNLIAEDEEGKETELKYEKDALGNVKDSIIEDIPLDLIEEIAGHILETSRFGTKEAGN